MICAYIFASERYYSLSKYTAIFKGKTVELFAYLKISLIPWWAYLNSRLHLIPCNPQHQIDLLSFSASEMTNCKGKTTYSLTHITNCLICILKKKCSTLNWEFQNCCCMQWSVPSHFYSSRFPDCNFAFMKCIR